MVYAEFPAIREETMATSVKELMSAANSAVPKISADEARKLISEENALLVDVRDAPELQASGKIKDALHVSRGMLEFRADADTPYYNAEFRKDRPVILYCASGGRSALSGKALKDMGYERVYNLGSFKDWAENGGDVEQM
jgi:rhodanese-related sulfurtransferase